MSMKSFLHSPFLLTDYKAFEEAAEHFQPYIKFFATFDKGVSIHTPHHWEIIDSFLHSLKPFHCKGIGFEARS